MRRFLITLVAAIFSLGLAFIFPFRTEAKVTTGKASCPEGKIKQMDGGVGCVIPLPVRPPGKDGGSNPNDWGMCGVLNMSADFGPPTVARIIVDPSGFYAVELIGFTAKVIPTLDWTCVLFSDFKGVPPPSDASSFTPPSFDGGSAGGIKKIAGSTGNACIWAGLSGNLETINQAEGGAFGLAYAQFEGPETAFRSQNVKTFAFCSSYTAASWKEWKYFLHGLTTSVPTHLSSIGHTDAQAWCYMDGIESHLLTPPFSVGTIDAGLHLSSSGDYSINATPHGGAWMSYNCLPLVQ
jgi:hypothetical protein